MKIVWSPQAEQDIEEIFDFILQDDPTAAWSIYRRIREQIELLSSQPHLGRPGRVPKTRELVISGTPYIVPYRVINQVLQILRIYHGARQWPAHFG